MNTLSFRHFSKLKIIFVEGEGSMRGFENSLQVDDQNQFPLHSPEEIPLDDFTANSNLTILQTSLYQLDKQFR